MKRTLVLLFLCLALVLAACDAPHPLRLGSNQWPGYEPVYLARELGLFSSNDIKLIEAPSSSEVMQYLRNGSLDAGMLTLDEVISLLSDGVPLKVVLVMDISHGADSVLAKPGITSLAQLRGHRIGVETSAVGAVMLESLLDAAELEGHEVQLAHLPVDQHARAFRDGEVDVLITFEPVRSQLLTEGAYELFNSKRIPDRIVDVLAVRKDSLTHHGQQLQRLLAAYFTARERMRSSPRDAYRHMAPRLETDADTLEVMFTGMQLPDLEQNRDWLEGSHRLERQARKLAELMQQWKLIPSQPRLEGLANSEFLPSQ